MNRCPRECNVFVRQLKKKKKLKKEKSRERKYSVTMEEVPDEEMPNEENPITIEKDDQKDLFRFIRGGQSWNLNPQKVDKTTEELVPEKYHDYLSVFQKKESERMPLRKPWDHGIEMKPGFKPKKSKVYPLSPQEQVEVDDFINEQLRKGYIRPSKSPQTSPIFFVPKKDLKKRMCTDYRYLNEWTVKNAYPLPLISEIIDKVGMAKRFTKLDLRWGYNNVRIKEGDEWKAAFATRRGSFEPLVMFFGMTNSPPTFQNMMNDILKEEIDRGVVIVFIDDILIFTEGEEGHEEIVKEVLRKLKENDLFLKPEKCTFDATEIEFLGLVIGPDGIKMDPIKVEAITSWPIPKRIKEVQAFLGLANFYRRFVHDFSKVAAPLHNLTRKGVVWRWGETQQRAFEELKKKFVEGPVLVPVDFTRPLRVESDASDYATGAVLSMLCEDEKWHPCAYLSKGLNDVERNYDVHDKEMLGIIRALEAWRHYLEGAKHEVEIWTDHANLQYFMSAKKLNRRQARWALFLSRFNFHLIHKSGSLMKKADALSRRPDHKKGVENDNKDITLLKPEYFRIRAMRQGHLLIDGSEKETLSKIRNCTDMDEEVVKAVKEMKGEKKKTIKGDEWIEEQGLILFRGKVYVPKDIELRKEIVRLHHNTSISGHPGRWKTLELVMRNYWWPGISKFVLSYVDGCDTCQRGKSYPEMPAGKLMPNPIPTAPWIDISVDFITGLPEAQGYDSIFVVCDRFTKQVHIIPTTKETSSLGLARLYRDHVWKLHGLPNTVISDRGPQFAAAFMKELNKILGIQTKLSTAYHPQTDGQTERMNQELEQYLRLFVDHRQTDWPEWLAIAEFSYNNKFQSSIRVSPFYANYGYNPRMGFEPRRKVKVQAVEDFVQRMKNVQAEAEAALHKARDDMKRYADRLRADAPKYQIGDKVWLSTKDLHTTRPSRKLMEKHIGPYPISKIISPNAVELKLPSSFKIDAPINVSRLRPYKPPTIPGQQTTPQPPIEVEGEPEFMVEEILDSRLRRNKLEFLVKWEGYTDENNSWEPEDNCRNARDAIRDFYDKYPNAPRRIARMQYENLKFRPYQNFTVPDYHTISRLEVEE
jgi:hypothetical protein